MPEHRVDFLLIGGGIASAACARTLREEGVDGSILLATREMDAPYHRPPASKGYLQGRESRDDTRVLAPEWWDEHDVELRTRASVSGLDLEGRTAKIGKDEVRFDKALLATGAMVRRLQVDGAADFDGVHYLRALGNADSIRRDAENAEQVVLVGGSYIGCEVAASLTKLGKRCTILMQESEPMERAFGCEAGRFVRSVLEEHGIEIVGDDEVESFTGRDERVTAVVTKGGRELPADLVVCGVGAQPDVMLARKAGLDLGDAGGVRCDARLQTSTPGVYAAGDMCEYDSALHGGHVRIEHEDVARTQGETVARNMLAADEPYTVVPYFWSDLADWTTLEYLGAAQRWDREVLRGSPRDGDFTVCYLDGDRLVAALAVGRSPDLEHARRLIASHACAPELADASADLGDLVAAAS
ncbi:FAD-dependent oxidoreductase [Thermoleophilia bacterium SCSIO 60948]|nr:FAD-dependent oxidoreductase [Thermoleophilia bacterium SCSIO 60948]